MKKLILCFVSLIFLSSTMGCSVFMAGNQPDEKNLFLLQPGTKRDLVVEELGAPISSETNADGELEETYKFVQGYSGGAKMGRAGFHAVADILTLGLWEVVGTPIELAADGDKLLLMVTYDERNTIIKVTPLNEDAKEELEDALKPKEETQVADDCDPGMESCN